MPTPCCNQVLRIHVVVSNTDTHGVSLHRRSLGEHKRTCSQQQKKERGRGEDKHETRKERMKNSKFADTMHVTDITQHPGHGVQP